MHPKKIRTFVCASLLTLFCGGAQGGPFSNISQWIDENLIDPEDDMLDASKYLASAQGFLPIPVIITEPAIGTGFGLGIAYFHPPKEIDREEHAHSGPPSISFGIGAGTDNGTRLMGGGHLGVWKDDHIRYMGGIGKADVNLTTYRNNSDDGESYSNGIDFNLDGDFLFQQIQFRLSESNWWLGTNYIASHATNSFDLGDALPPEFPALKFDFDTASVGAFIQYDSRNTVFTPSDGLSAKLDYKNYGETWGSDYDYDSIKLALLHFTPIGEFSSLGLRLQSEKVDGNTPFFAYPFVALRGIPAMRYQGETATTAEIEYLWGVTPRWSVALFAGAGETSDIDALGSRGEFVTTQGIGFRYRLAKTFGLQSGVDFAHGPEGNSVYLTVGSAWF